MRAFPELTAQEEEALREESLDRSLEDLHYFAKHILGYDRVTDHIHKRMARDIDTPNYKFKLLLWPRGSFKSTIGTESRSIQALLRNPNERILLTNAKLENSRKFLRAIAHHFKANPRFRWLARDWWIDKHATPYHRANMGDKLDWVVRDTQDEFTVLRPYEGREASITTGAVDASLVSQHFGLIVADDLINRDYVRTIEMVEKSILYFKDLLDLLDSDGRLELIGTRWAHIDLYNWIIEEFGGIASLRVPKDYVSKDIVEASEKTPRDRKEWMISIQPCYDEDGEPIFPEEFSHEVLQRLERAKGPYEFGAQYRLNPTPAESQKIKEEWFNKLDVMPDAQNLSVCITVDPAKSLEDRADNTAIAVFGYDDHNNMYLLDGRDEQLAIDELPEALWDIVTRWYTEAKFVYPVGFEAVGFQETYIFTLERMMRERNFFFGIDPIKHRNTSKEERIYRLVPRVKHGFFVPRRLMITPYADRDKAPYDLTQRLMWQLTKFPLAGKDDLADATADQLNIVRALALPTKGEKRERPPISSFVHRSILEDKRKSAGMRRSRMQFNDAVR